jgi:O-antigen ligase
LTTVILAAGLLMVAALAAAIVRSEWRLPAIAFGALAIPGNVDDLLPEMSLDPHPIQDTLAPVATSLDALIVWAVVLTVIERRSLSGRSLLVLLLACAFAVMGTITVLVHLASGLDPGGGTRGIILVWRIVGLLYLSLALRAEIGSGRLLGLAIVAGGVVLLGNGIYTTLSSDLERFTAKTFGRNGFAIALAVVSVVGAATAFDRWSSARSLVDRLIAIGCGVVAGACLYGMSATGTRMAIVVIVVAAIGAIVLYPGHIGRRETRNIAITGVLAVLVLGASVLFTTAGGRTLSVITDPSNTVDVVTDPGATPTETEIRSRGEFWDLAIAMAKEQPLVGVGPFQWNFRRYVLDPSGPVVVADAHESYLQIAAEYGFVTLALYLVLMAACGLTVLLAVLWRRHRASIGWAGMGLIVGASVIPIAATTNAHVTNPRNGPLEWLLIGAATAIAISMTERSRSGVEAPTSFASGATTAPGR